MASIGIGLLCLAFIVFSVGGAAAAFLLLINEASRFFHTHSTLIYALPLLGLVTGLCYWRFGRHLPTTQKVLHQAHHDEASLPFLTAFFIFTFTILSQVFGASTGRESTAVQFGAALGQFWQNIFKRFSLPERFGRQAYIRAGLAAGFGAVFGVPWAGAIFALESTPHHRWPFRLLPVCWISSFGAHWVALWCGAHHTLYPSFPKLHWDWILLAKWIALGIAFGLMAKVFVILLQFTERHFFKRFFPLWLAPVMGGICVAVLTLLLGDLRYNGLGTELISNAFESGVHRLDFVWKSIFTILSSGSGFKGGEVTPLMAVGATLGVSVSSLLSLPATYAASLGLIGVFASSVHIPWTGAIMAWELFGFEAFLPAFIVCWVAQRLVHSHGLYAVNE